MGWFDNFVWKVKIFYILRHQKYHYFIKKPSDDDIDVTHFHYKTHFIDISVIANSKNVKKKYASNQI